MDKPKEQNRTKYRMTNMRKDIENAHVNIKNMLNDKKTVQINGQRVCRLNKNHSNRLSDRHQNLLI